MTFRKNNNLKSPWSGDPNGEQTPAMPRLEAGMAKLFALRRPATGRVEATASPPTGLRDSRDPGRVNVLKKGQRGCTKAPQI